MKSIPCTYCGGRPFDGQEPCPSCAGAGHVLLCDCGGWVAQDASQRFCEACQSKRTVTTIRVARDNRQRYAAYLSKLGKEQP